MESTGEGGLISELVRTALERGLEAGMTSHLGYGPGDWAGKDVFRQVGVSCLVMYFFRV